jgi:hypothetical protein
MASFGMDEVEDLVDPITVPDDMGPELTDILPQGYLSVSAAKMHLKCPHSWQLKYIDKKPQLTPARMFQGVVVHKAADVVLTAKLETGVVPPVELATDTFASEFEAKKGRVDDWEGQTEGQVKDTGIECAKVYWRDAAQAATPVAVEKTFATVIKTRDGKVRLPVLGRIDSVQVQVCSEAEYQDIRAKVVAGARKVAGAKKGKADRATEMPTVSRPLRLHDLKVVTDKWSEGALKNDLQFLLYAGAEHVPDVQVDQVVKGRAKVPRPRYEALSDVLTDADVQHGVAVLEGVALSIASGRFPMTDPSNWWCSASFCSVWRFCRGAQS